MVSSGCRVLTLQREDIGQQGKAAVLCRMRSDMIGGGYFQFLGISVFFIHRKLRPMNEILSVWRNRVAPRENAPDWKKFRSGAFSFVEKQIYPQGVRFMICTTCSCIS